MVASGSVKMCATVWARWTTRLLIGMALLLPSARGSSPDQPVLHNPVVCPEQEICVIQNYFDHAPGPDFRDYACGHLGYDGHDGIDIRVANRRIMGQGVPVVAAAAGIVRAIRDEMPDISIRDGGVEQVRDREAGNAVAIRHGADWETQYSHLLLGSVRVRPGDRVEAGDVLGMIGLSGKTEFPHLHFAVRYKGESIDPFVGLDGGASCGLGRAPLWHPSALAALGYIPTGRLQAGFLDAVPDRFVRTWGRTLPDRQPGSIDPLVFWVELFGVRQGDREEIRLLDPDGVVLAESGSIIEKNKALWFKFVGKRRPEGGWKPGVYRATYRLLRASTGGAAQQDLVVDIAEAIEIGP